MSDIYGGLLVRDPIIPVFLGRPIFYNASVMWLEMIYIWRPFYIHIDFYAIQLLDYYNYTVIKGIESTIITNDYYHVIPRFTRLM